MAILKQTRTTISSQSFLIFQFCSHELIRLRNTTGFSKVISVLQLRRQKPKISLLSLALGAFPEMATPEVPGLEQLPPITVIPWKEFKENPYLMYNRFYRAARSKGRTYHSDHALFEEDVRNMKAHNVDDLQGIIDNIYSKPILFRIFIEHKQQESVFHNGLWEDEIAVLVNPAKMKAILSPTFAEILNIAQEGGKFNLMIDFKESVHSWYRSILQTHRGHTSSDEIAINISNCSAVDVFTMPGCIICCFPCWLLFGGPCIYANRKRTQDMKKKLYFLTVVLLTGRYTQNPGDVQHHFLYGRRTALKNCTQIVPPQD